MEWNDFNWPSRLSWIDWQQSILFLSYLTTVTIPVSVEFIDGNPFAYWGKLQPLQLQKGTLSFSHWMAYYAAGNWWRLLLNLEDSQYKKYNYKCRLCSCWMFIAEFNYHSRKTKCHCWQCNFELRWIKSAVIPTSATKIEENAFNKCSWLRSVFVSKALSYPSNEFPISAKLNALWRNSPIICIEQKLPSSS